MTKSLSPPDLDRHRADLGIELEVASVKVDRFGWSKMPEALRIRLRQDWMDALQDFGLDEVRAACGEALEENPREATNEGRIKARIIAARARRLAALPKPPEPMPEIRKPDAAIRAAQAAELLSTFKRMDTTE